MRRPPLLYFLLFLSDALVTSPSQNIDASTNVTKILVEIDDQSLVLNLPSDLYASNVYTLCAAYDLDDEHCQELQDYAKSKVEEQGLSTSRVKTQRQIMSYSNVMLPSYFISLNSVYRAPPRNHGVVVAAPPDMRKAVNMALARFQGGNLDELLQYDPAMSECIKIAILSSRITVSLPKTQPKYWWRQRRLSDFIRMLHYVSSKLPDLELVFCPHDCPPQTNATASFGYPTSYGGEFQQSPASAGMTFFGLVQCDHSASVSVPLVSPRGKDDPTFSTLDDFKDLLRLNERWRNQTASIKKAVWRGQVKGKSCWSGVQGEGVEEGRRDERCGRRKLLSISARNVDLFDVHLTDYIELQRQTIFAANVAVEGHCGWTDRTSFLSHMGSALVKQESFCKSWYEDMMQPWVHYVPTDYLLENLEKNVKYILDDDDVRERMVKNMNEWASHVICQDGMTDFLVMLMKEYAEKRRQAGWSDVIVEGNVTAEKYLKRMRIYERLELGGRD